MGVSRRIVRKEKSMHIRFHEFSREFEQVVLSCNYERYHDIFIEYFNRWFEICKNRNYKGRYLYGFTKKFAPVTNWELKQTKNARK